MGERDRYKSAPISHLEDQRDRLQIMANEAKFTPGTRELARREAEYVVNVLSFRALPASERRALLESGVAPWFENWPLEK